MKIKWWKYCLTLALLLIIIPLSSTVKADQYQSKDAMNYVIVIDASDVNSDQFVGIEMCSLLTALTADENARIGVIAYGYEGTVHDRHPYTHYPKPKFDAQYVHLLLPLEDINRSTDAAIRQRVQNAFDYAEKRSPHGQALLAAVDLLTAAETPAGQGCVILISDGIRIAKDIPTEELCQNTAITDAASNSWPIYTIRLARSTESSIAIDTMNNIAVGSGAGGSEGSEPRGTWTINPVGESPVSDCHKAIMQILMKTEPDGTSPRNGRITRSDTINNLTCTRTLGFSGRGLRSVTVNSASTGEQTFTETTEDKFVSAVFGESYIVVRFKSPIPEEWTVRVNTDSTEKVFVYDMARHTPDIVLSVKIDHAPEATHSEDCDLELKPNQSISFESAYYYQGNPLEINKTDASITAELEIQTYDPNQEKPSKEVMTLKLDPQLTGHISRSIVLDEILDEEYRRYENTSGTYRARVVLTSDQNPLTHQYSDWFCFEVNDPVCEWDGGPVQDPKCSANGTFEIQLEGNLSRPDNDELEFELFNNDGFEFVFIDKNGNECSTYRGNPDFLEIKCCEYIGTHDVTLSIRDGNHTETIPFKVTVTPPDSETSDEIAPATLYEDSVFFKEKPHEYKETLNLEVIDVIPTESYDSEVVEFFYDHTNKQILLRAKNPGTTIVELKLTYTAQEKDEYGDYIPYVRFQRYEIIVESAGIYRVLCSLPFIVVGIILCYLIKEIVLGYMIDGTWNCTLEVKGMGKKCIIPVKDKTINPGHFFASIPMDGFIRECIETLRSGKNLNIPEDQDNILQKIKDTYSAPKHLHKLRICGTFMKKTPTIKGIPAEQEGQLLMVEKVGAKKSAHARKLTFTQNDTVNIQVTLIPKDEKHTSQNVTLVFTIAGESQSINATNSSNS